MAEALPTIRLLLVDDDSHYAAALLRKLVHVPNADAEVIPTWASTVHAALAVLEHNHINLVLLDKRMPDCDWEEALATLRRATEVPVAIFTAYPEGPEARESARDHGAADYIAKADASSPHFVKRLLTILGRDERHQKEIVAAFIAANATPEQMARIERMVKEGNPVAQRATLASAGSHVAEARRR